IIGHLIKTALGFLGL
uniref:Signiferin-2.2 n=1 Tax=Crinia signifera TaxID=326986 RepID=SIG22_CRISI|nr:RecName: Full=Signiferin-2.2 [Crinia signifera]